MEKWYEFHWKTGEVEYLKGTSETDAANKAGIGAGALAALDYTKEAESLPTAYKEFTLIGIDGAKKALGNSTLFVERAITNIDAGEETFSITVLSSTWRVKAVVEPFKVLLYELG